MRIPAMVFTLLVLQVLPSSAEEIFSKSEISDVLIFPRGAEVTRTTKLSLVKGNHTVILRDLPSSVVSNSVRISGKSGGPLNVVSVDTRKIYVDHGTAGEHLHQRETIETAIQKLRDKIAALDGKIRTAELQNRFLESLATQRVGSLGQPSSALNHPQEWSGLLEFIESRSNTLNKNILDIEINKRNLTRKLEILKKKLQNQPNKSEERTEVKVHVVAVTPLQGTLVVKYQVRQAGWRPLYDARLYTGKEAKKSDLEITRLAEIFQSSGEDWNNVNLSLSTTRPQSVSQAPELNTQKIIAAEEKTLPKVAEERTEQKFKNKTILSHSKPMSNRPGSIAGNEQTLNFGRPRIHTVRTSFQAIFLVPGKVVVDTSGIKKKVSLNVLKLKPSLRAISVPKVDKTAYLHAKFKLTGNIPLIPGRVSLYRDGIFVGTGMIPELNPGVEHDLGFGADDAVEIKRIELGRSKGEAGLINTSKTDERNFLIKVQNRHDHGIPVTIYDQIPYANDEKIEVQMLSKTTRPARENVFDKRGVLAWDMDLKAGEKREIFLSYKIIWPADMKIIVSP